MAHPSLPLPSQPLNVLPSASRSAPGHLPRGSRLRWLVLSTSLLAAALGPGCLARGGESDDVADGETEDSAEVEEAINAGVNLAQGKPVSQSSTYSADGVASHAVDGNTSGKWTDGSVTHTQAELSPWWQVDLGSSQYVGAVELYNRTDCCSERLNNFSLLVSDDGSNWQSWGYPGKVGARVSFGVNRSARYVKVQLNSTGAADRILSLAEVKVYAPPNLAQGKTATQSTTYFALGAASHAVDGSTDGSIPNGSVTHSDAELSPWWQVDLGSVQNAGRIDLYNRTDCCSDRLSNFKLLLSEDGATWQSWSYPGVAGARTSFDVNRSARFVKVQLNSTGVARYLSLAEVIVYAAANASPTTSLSTSSTLSPTAPVGAVDGQFDVDAQGSATYSIPIKVPPGTNGVEPKLSLAYRSAGNNGLTGMGWGLAGLSMITRCPRTVAQDGVHGAVDGTANDRFCLDGKRLIGVSGTYGADGAQYRTELESFSRVISYGICGTGPCRFEVTDKSGNKAVLGGTSDSQAMIGSTVRAWGMNKLSSRHGNYLTVSYTAESGQIYPQQILYTMNDAAPSLKKRKVAFSYEGRTDAELRYFAGYKLYMAGKRLAGIKTYVGSAQGDVPVRDYRLVYTASPATGRSLLSTVTECDGQGVCLPSTQLDYLSAAGVTFTKKEPSGPQFQDWLRYDPGAIIIPGDFNGDGKTDFLRQERGGWGGDTVNNLMVYFSTGAGTFSVTQATCMVNGDNHCQSWMSLDAGAFLYPADINGDGITDFYRQEHGGWGASGGNNFEAYLSNGDGSFQPFAIAQSSLAYDGGGPSDPGTYIYPGDFDGNGTTDFVAQARGFPGFYGWVSTGHLQVGQWNGSGFTLSAPPVNVGGMDWFAEAMIHDEGAFLFPGDYNGDGITDLLRQEHYMWNPDDDHNLQIYLSRGGGQWTLAEPHQYQPNGVDLIQNDMNYDPGAFVIPGDYNGDGLTDFIRQEHGDWGNADYLNTFRVYFSDGVGGFDMFQPIGAEYQVELRGDDYEIIPIDYNGDHKTDFIRRRKGAFLANKVNFSLFISRGDGTFNVLSPGNPSDPGDLYQSMLTPDNTNLLTGDFDGDGKTDLIRQEKGAYDDDLYGTFQVLLADGDDAVDSLKKVTTGLGGTVDVQYAPLTDGAVYTKGTGATGSLADLQSPMYVVKSYQTSSGAGQSVSHSYAYSGARVDHDGRGFVGFAKVTRTSAASQNSTVIEYNQSPFPLTGTVKSRTVQSADGAAKIRTDYTYGTSTTYSGVYVLTTSREDITHTEGPQSYKTVKEYEYDAWGNLTILHDRGLDGDASDDVDTCTTYSGGDALSLWSLDSPLYTRVAQSCAIVNGSCQCSGVLNWIDRYYDWATMNVTTVYEQDDRYSRWPYVAFTYDALGNVATRSSPGSSTRIVETNTYDPDYQTFLVAQTKTGGSLSFTTTSAFDPRFGTLVSQTDVNGNTTSTALDGLGRVAEKSQTSPDGYLVPTARVVYGSDAGGAYRETDTRTAWQSDAWRWQREYLDGAGQVRRVSAQSDSASPILKDRTFDAAGQVAAETQPYYQSVTPVWQAYTRDWLGRLVQTTDAAGSVTKVAYSIDTSACPLCAMKVTTTEGFGSPAQRTWTRHNDAQDSARRQVDPEGRVTTFGYDRIERRTSVSDLAGTTTTVYDSLNRVTSVTSPDRGTLTNEYGTGDWLSSTTDANGVVTTYTYDDLGRVAQKAVTGGETTTFAYDNAAYANGLGRLTSVKVIPYGQQTPSSTNDFAYTPSGAVATNVMGIDGHVYTLTSTYDPEGRLRDFTYPDGLTLSRSYSALGGLSQLKLGGTVYAQYDLFSELGKPGKVSYPNGTSSTYTYDTAGRLTAMATKGPNNTSLMSYQYTWDAIHQITQVTDQVNSSRTQYLTYSAAGQLTGAASGVYGVLSYAYDSSGNMTSKEGASYAYANHRVILGTGFSATYDAAGNRTSQTVGADTYQYAYGAESRMTQVSKNNAVMEQYRYDFAGERVKKVDANGTTTFYVTPAFEVTYLPDGRRLETKYIQGPSGRVAAVTTEIPAGSAMMLDFRGLDSASRLFDKGSVAGLLGYVAQRARSLRAHPDAPLWGEIALALALVSAGVALARRRAPRKVAAALRALRAVALPEKTAFVRRHPVFAFVLPIVAAAFLSACTRVPAEQALSHAQDDLVAGANGDGNPVAGIYFFHQNHIGSSSVITDAFGAEVARAEYKPYGEIVQAWSPGQDIFRAKFAGKEWDKDASLYYFNARYYDPLTGRFMSADTQVQGGAERNAAAVNPYAYGNNSPIIYHDPSGHFFFLIIIVAVCVGAFAGGMNANGGSWNPASWNWSSWSTYVGMGVGGIVGAMSAGVGVGVGGFAGAMASSLINSVALNGLKFLSPQGSSLEEFGIGLGMDMAMGAVTGGVMAGPRNQFGATFTERLSGKIAQQATAALVGRELGKAAVKLGGRIGMQVARDNRYDSATVNALKDMTDTPDRSRPEEPPSRVDFNQVSSFVSSMADALLGAAGGDDVPGRSLRNARSGGRGPSLAPSLAMAR